VERILANMMPIVANETWRCAPFDPRPIPASLAGGAGEPAGPLQAKERNERHLTFAFLLTGIKEARRKRGDGIGRHFRDKLSDEATYPFVFSPLKPKIRTSLGTRIGSTHRWDSVFSQKRV
jgi:hypothetical protein